jgi:CBS domain containing-hemolysin-like protein
MASAPDRWTAATRLQASAQNKMHLFERLAATDILHVNWVAPEVALLQILTVFFLVFLNGFFVASEFAIVKVRDSQIASLANQGGQRVRIARHIIAHLDAYLSATQLGITLASLGLGWVGEPFIAHMLHPVFPLVGVQSEVVIKTTSLAIAFGIITFLHIVLGELAPKSLAIRQPVPTTLWISRPLELFYCIFKPAIWLLQGAANLLLKHLLRIEPVGEHELAHSKEELRLLLAESEKAQAVTALGARISGRAFELQHLTARDIATPRPDVVFLDEAEPFAENLHRAKRSGHTRFPLCHGHLDEALGLIHIKDMIALDGEPTPELAAIKRELPAVPEMMSLEKLLDLFLKSRTHLALVLDEFGGATGIVTLDNVIEEIVGDIRDEFDSEQSEIERASVDEFTVRGRLPLHELRAHTGLEVDSEEVSTVGGYVTHVLGHLPQEGETVRVGDYRATVTKCDGRRVRRVKFQRSATGAAP